MNSRKKRLFQISRRYLWNKYWSEKRLILNSEFNFIYCPVSKVACSSFREMMVLLSNDLKAKQKLADGSLDVHYYALNNLGLDQYGYQRRQEIVNNQKYFKFVIVRNPWSRLVSGYFNKFVEDFWINNEPFDKSVVKSVYQSQNLPLDYQKSITFRQFMEYCYRTEDMEMNPHWRPQHLFLGDIKFDFIGRFENLQQDFEYIKQKTNIPLDLPRRRPTVRNKNIYSNLDSKTNCSDYYPADFIRLNVCPNYQQFYTPDLIELVRERYQEDITRFNYDFAN